MSTLSELLSTLSKKYNVSKRPSRYFDVKKRGKLSKEEISYVKKRFKELVDREECVSEDPDDPICYKKVSTDKKPLRKKRKSSYLKDYYKIYRNLGNTSFKVWVKSNQSEYKKVLKKTSKLGIDPPDGLIRISIETDLPIQFLDEVYRKGVGAYASSGSRTGMSAEQWGYGRVYSFIMSYFHNDDGQYDKKRFLKSKTDYDIYEKIIGRKNPASKTDIRLFGNAINCINEVVCIHTNRTKQVWSIKDTTRNHKLLAYAKDAVWQENVTWTQPSLSLARRTFHPNPEPEIKRTGQGERSVQVFTQGKMLSFDSEFLNNDKIKEIEQLINNGDYRDITYNPFNPLMVGAFRDRETLKGISHSKYCFLCWFEDENGVRKAKSLAVGEIKWINEDNLEEFRKSIIKNNN